MTDRDIPDIRAHQQHPDLRFDEECTEVAPPLSDKQSRIATALDLAESHLKKFTNGRVEVTIPDDRRAYLFMGIYSDEEMDSLPDIINAFVQQNSNKLHFNYTRYAQDSRCDPILYEPGALLLLERLERRPNFLRNEWEPLLPLKHLQNLALFWGTTLDYD